MPKYSPPEGRFIPSATRDINLLLTHISELPRIIAIACEQNPGHDNASLARAVAEKVRISSNEIRRVFIALENMHLIAMGFSTKDEVVDRMKRGVDADLAKKIEEHRTEILSVMESYKVDNAISISLKATRLSYRRNFLFRDAEITTDTRPVFNSEASNIVQFIITHEIEIKYDEDGDTSKMYLALDNADLIQLKNLCDRAILKARVLKETLDKVRPTKILSDET